MRDFVVAQRFAQGRMPVPARICRIAKFVNHAWQVCPALWCDSAWTSQRPTNR
jgi:hypothetical protein